MYCVEIESQWNGKLKITGVPAPPFSVPNFTVVLITIGSETTVGGHVYPAGQTKNAFGFAVIVVP